MQPQAKRWARRLALGYGAALLLWLSVEDNAVWPVTVFGLGLCILIMGLTTFDRINLASVPAHWLPIVSTVFGLLVGMGTAVATAGLMFFKNALHAHVFLDFPPALMLAMLQRAPQWGAAGALIGLSLGLVWLAVRVE